MESLRVVAGELGIPERTLRRAAAQGLVRGERVSERKFNTTLRERDYLRRHWPLLSRLRGALRTEPNVAFAALFGSFASGVETGASDIDLIVELRDPGLDRLAELGERLTRELHRDVEVVRLADAKGNPSLLADLVDKGRVLVDREHVWRRLVAEVAPISPEPRLEELVSTLDLGP